MVERYPSGTRRHAEYRLDGERVGRRAFSETGDVEHEWPERGGRAHGWQLRWDEPGELLSATPYRYGLEHGTATQWCNGELVGTYRMVRGTGIDLWWGYTQTGPITLTEARYMRDGHRHGFEWWINVDQRSVHEESHHRDGVPHGIERQWNIATGRLRRGFPKYWVLGKQTTKRGYLAAASKDATLPPFRKRDDSPRRVFPPEVAVELGPRKLPVPGGSKRRRAR